MDLRRTNQAFKGAAIALAAGALVALLLALFWPLAAPTDPSATPSASRGIGSGAIHGAGADSDSNGTPPLKSFEPLWAMDLRRPLFDGPAAASAPRPPFAAKLAGTILEPGRSQAMFNVAAQGGGGQVVEFKAVGEKVAGAELLEITDTTATVLYYGDRLTLRVEQGGPN